MGSRKELALSPTLPLEANPSPVLRRPPKTLLPALLETATDVLEVLVYTATSTLPVLKISDVEKTENRAESLNADHLIQAIRLIVVDRVENAHRGP